MSENNSYKWDGVQNIVLLILVFAIIILCVGTPDLLDAIISRVSCSK